MVVVAHTEAGGNELVFLDEDYSVWPGKGARIQIIALNFICI